jgi:HEPN domain-containing protein
MSALLDRLKAGRSAIKEVTLNGVKFGLRVLTEQDYLEAQIATELAMREAGIELGLSSAEAFESEKASQLLLRALIDPAIKSPVADSAKALREALSRDEKTALIEEYLDHEKTFSPSERTMTDAEFSELVEAVKKTPENPLLNDLSSAMLKRLITTLVSQPAT